jgi:hypothetical protein
MTEREQKLLAILSVILEMSDAAQKLGGATSIAGVASLHKMQTSIQKHSNQIMQIVREIQQEEHDNG